MENFKIILPNMDVIFNNIISPFTQMKGGKN